MKQRFRILHCLRAPVGGLFRHVCDLATAQSRRGHGVAVVCADTGDALTPGRLDGLQGVLELGLHRLPMGREIGLTDWRAARQVAAIAARIGVDIIHGHGAKGGAYARLAARSSHRRRAPLACFYTPHGGSLHYAPSSPKGRLFMALERRLERFTDGLIFESAYSAGRYNDQVGAPRARALVIPNGVGPADFQPIAPRPDAADFVFVGELRLLKGVDVLIDALACLDAALAATAVIVGDGPDAARFRQQAAAAGLAGQVRFAGAMPAREAFSQGRMLVMPSRAESFPYVVLEAGAAGLPLIATDVGGIPEITAGTPVRLLPPDDPLALAAAMRAALAAPAELDASAAALRTRIAARFTVEAMTDAVLGFYDSATAG